MMTDGVKAGLITGLLLVPTIPVVMVVRAEQLDARYEMPTRVVVETPSGERWMCANRVVMDGKLIGGRGWVRFVSENEINGYIRDERCDIRTLDEAGRYRAWRYNEERGSDPPVLLPDSTDQRTGAGDG